MMDEDQLKEGFEPREEIEMIIQRFCRPKEDKLKVGKELKVDWLEDKERLRYKEEDEALDKILDHLDGLGKSDQISELERGLNVLSGHERNRFGWFSGHHFNVGYDGEAFEVIEGPDEDEHEDVRKEVKRSMRGSKIMGPFLKGILIGGHSRSDRIYTDWSEARAAGTKYYQGEGNFHPTREASLPDQLPGISSNKTNSGRSYTVAKELAPVIWEAICQFEEEKCKAVGNQDDDILFDQSIPKSQEVMDVVNVTEEDIEEFERILQEEDALEYWKDFIAPGVKFRDKAKKALLCMLASPEDKNGNKGRTNAIIYGPPGTGKTALKNFLTQKFGAYSIDGSRVSKVDLTHNKNTGEDGLLVRAHKGLAVIEEADEMNDDAMGAALTALGESGRLEIRDMTLPAEVRGVMLGNYESKEDIIRKHSEALLNRFEFIIEFEKFDDEKLNDTLDWHYRHYRKPKPKENATKLKKYLKWVRQFDPKIPREELEKISNFKKEKLSEIENVREGISILSVAWTIARLNHRDLKLRDYKKAFGLFEL